MIGIEGSILRQYIEGILMKYSRQHCTGDCEIFVVKNFSSTTFADEYEIVCITYIDLYQFWSLKSGDENLQAKYFTGENILIYGIEEHGSE